MNIGFIVEPNTESILGKCGVLSQLVFDKDNAPLLDRASSGLAKFHSLWHLHRGRQHLLKDFAGCRKRVLLAIGLIDGNRIANFREIAGRARNALNGTAITSMAWVTADENLPFKTKPD